MWCVAVLEGEGAPPYPASVRPIVLPNPSILLPFRINNRQGRDMVCGSTARCMRGGACLPPSPDNTAPDAPPLHLYSISDPAPQCRLRSVLSDDPAETTLPNPALLLSAAAQPAVAIPVAAQPAVAVPAASKPAITVLPDAVQPAVVVPAAAQLAVVVCSRTSRRPAPAAAVAHPPPTCRRLAAVQPAVAALSRRPACRRHSRTSRHPRACRRHTCRLHTRHRCTCSRTACRRCCALPAAAQLAVAVPAAA